MRELFKPKTWLITFAIFAAAILISTAVVLFEHREDIDIAQAGSADNVTGYAWSSNIGWISFNCTNDDSCGTVDYGVNINPASGNFSGYAWSSNIGWISFVESNPPDSYIFNSNCPDVCDATNNCTACYNSGDGNVYGWAKILSLEDDGWLKMNGSWSDGVSIDQATGDFSGWAWNGNDTGAGIGWVSFNCSNDDSCAASDYKVHGDINTPPTATALPAPNWSYDQACSYYARQAFLRWEFSDPDPDSSQSAYQVIFDDDSDPTDPIIDSGKTLGSANQYSVGPDQLSYDTPYYWWVRVWDNYDVASDLVQYNSVTDTDNDDGNNLTFTTYKHEFPDVDFSWSPQNPSQGEDVQFTDNSIVYGGATISSWQWTVPEDATIDDATISAPTITFGSSGSQTVTLKVTDSDGYYCSETKQININVALPEWKEVK